ncbi:heme A synthase [Deinobacterium chartae]|uniref:Heme A synthase n=1 Tax=Deinobacterium chartae TaxID=521158 RepID=A0A841I6U7_9DEIO|nr:heme A synthase [Deinobacterium chartae]
MKPPRLAFSTFAWILFAYLVLVILWGAWVRISGSGAGCGSHWPLCNGAVVPMSPTLETLTELVHRVTSTLSGLLIIAMLVWAFRRFPKGHGARLGSVLALVFVIIEGLLGAGLVVFELVGNNESAVRAVYLPLHLANTFVLLGVTAYTALTGQNIRPTLRSQGSLPLLVGGGLLLTLLVGMSGAIAALGDTLYPAHSLESALRHDFDAAAPLLIQLRVLHPTLAIASAVYLVFLGVLLSAQRSTPAVKVWSKALYLAIALQIAAGIANVALLAPGWLQIVHLLLACLMWLCTVMLCLHALDHRLVSPRLGLAGAQVGHD